MGRPARPLHDPGNHRAIERGFVRQAACRGLTKPAKPAGDQEQPGTLTPPQGARSDVLNRLNPVCDSTLHLVTRMLGLGRPVVSGDDGIVSYQSAYIPEAASEL